MNASPLEIKIERGIEIPSESRGRKTVYPFDSMAPGDSFLLPSTNRDEAIGTAQRVRSSVCQRARRKGERYKVVMVEGGVRVWLISRGNKKVRA